MSKTTRGSKPTGYDYWSRRCFGHMGMGYGKVAKWITKKIERTRDKVMCRKAMKNPECYEKRFPGE